MTNFARRPSVRIAWAILRPREGVHAADVGVEQVDRLETLAPNFGVEIDSAGRQAPHLKNGKHAASRQVNIGRKLIGIPAQKRIARVGIDRTERSGGKRNSELMLHFVTGQGRVIGFEVELEVGQEFVRAGS